MKILGGRHKGREGKGRVGGLRGHAEVHEPVPVSMSLLALSGGSSRGLVRLQRNSTKIDSTRGGITKTMHGINTIIGPMSGFTALSHEKSEIGSSISCRACRVEVAGSYRMHICMHAKRHG